MKQVNRFLVLLLFFSIITVKGYSQYITEGFESGSFPSGWIKTSNWVVLNNVSHAHGGSYAAFASSMSGGNNDWLITPQITVSTGDIFAFYARSWVSTENFSVKLSTTGTNYSNFNVTLANVTNIGTGYTRYQYNLDAYAGQNIYLAIYWTRDTYGLLIDDMTIGQIAPGITLPSSFSFVQGNQLVSNFSPYIQIMNPDVATLSVTGNTNINVLINGFNVTFTSPAWNGTESLTFSLNDGQGKTIVSDIVDVIVTPQAVDDVGMLSIQVPAEYSFLNTDITPSCTIKNYGASVITNDIQIKCSIFDQSNNQVYTQTSVYSNDLAINEEAQIVFSNAWHPTAEGNYHIIMNTIYNGDINTTNDTLRNNTIVVEHFGNGGPDGMGYKWIDNKVSGGPTYNWIEISGTGQSAVMYESGVTFSGDDNFSSPIPFGFSFPFYGIPRDSFYVDINGEILLADNIWYTPYPASGWDNDGMLFNYTYPVPGFSEMPALVAVYWDDLFAEDGTGNIYFQTFGTAPNRYCVIQWNNLKFAAGTSATNTLTFEAIFKESGEIVFQYKDVAIGQSGSNAPHDNGRSATVGIQNDDAAIGLCYLREIVVNNNYVGVEPLGNLLTDGLAIKFYPDVDLQAPHMVLKNEIGNTFNNNIELSVNVTDMSNILYDTLYYNIGNGWQGITHSNIKSINDFVYQVPAMSNSTTVSYYFSATDNSAARNRAILPADAPNHCYSFKILPTNGVEVLLATPGTKPGYQDYQKTEFNKYIAVLDAANIDYDIYNWAEYSQYRIPNTYKTIFLYSNSFNNMNGKGDSLSKALMDFLRMGTPEYPKNIFTASDGFADGAYAMPNASPLAQFSRAFLRICFIPQLNYPYYGGTDGIGGPSINGYANGSIIGFANSPIGTANVEIPVLADSPDNFINGPCPEWFDTLVPNPEISSQISFLFEDGPIGGNAFSKGNNCGVWLDNLTYKSFFISFDISQFVNDQDINTTINQALTWFGTTVNTGNFSESNFTTNAFPNPFSTEVNISYTVPEKSTVCIEIYNLNGQLIKILDSGKKESGTHTVVWNVKEDKDINLPEGVYFYKISINGSAKTSKLVLIK